MSIRNAIIVLIIAVSLSACMSVPPCNLFNSDVVERLYFGRSIGANGFVSDSSWTAFLQESITPRFPNGFTVWKAEGQWRGANGVPVQEQSFVVEIIHPADAANAETAIKQIINEYKRCYRQESVLHVITPAQADY